jgi:hypothetical protein
VSAAAAGQRTVRLALRRVFFCHVVAGRGLSFAARPSRCHAFAARLHARGQAVQCRARRVSSCAARAKVAALAHSARAPSILEASLNGVPSGHIPRARLARPARSARRYGRFHLRLRDARRAGLQGRPAGGGAVCLAAAAVAAGRRAVVRRGGCLLRQRAACRRAAHANAAGDGGGGGAAVRGVRRRAARGEVNRVRPLDVQRVPRPPTCKGARHGALPRAPRRARPQRVARPGGRPALGC